jgi:hypothetical protein
VYHQAIFNREELTARRRDITRFQNEIPRMISVKEEIKLKRGQIQSMPIKPASRTAKQGIKRRKRELKVWLGGKGQAAREGR